MHFKSLELVGFKSFADKTRFDFEPGVTAIVGPNGCGKSNVVDAIRWVMGEQNARMLRGMRMEDVIFNGTDDRKGVGFAEVSLTLTDVSSQLRVDYNEITVTRRAFRSGEGQYLINKTPCRLKDIDDLFMGTGIGLSAYSIIEQGKMDMVLSSKPEDRRFIFEEAAGITKYKEKKREALRRLQSTEENLVRLSDIIKEVKRQLASVERQAARARRAREVADELKGIEMRFSARRLAEIDAVIRESGLERDAARQQEAGIRKSIGDLEAEQHRLHEELHALDLQLGSVQARRVGVSGGIESSQGRIKTDERLIGGLEESEAGCAREIEQLGASLRALREEEEGLRTALGNAVGALEKATADLGAAERTFGEIQRQLGEGEATIGQMRAELIDCANLLSQKRNELAGAKQESRSASLRMTRLQVEQRELTEKIELATRDLREKSSRRADLEKGRDGAARASDEAQERLREARRLEERLREERMAREKALSSCESHYEILERYRDSCDGYISGVRAIMAEASREGTGIEGILGTVAEKIRARPDYGRALEVSLGHALQTILARSLESALGAMTFLEGGMEASLLPLEGLAGQPDAPPPQGQGLLGRMIDFTVVDPDFEPAARYLLGNTYCVASLGDALEIRKGCAPGMRIATLAGELVVAGGGVAVTGEERGASIAARQHEIHELRGKRSSLHRDRDEAVGKLEACAAQCAQMETACADAREALKRCDIELAEARAEDARAAALCEGFQAELAVARSEIAEIEASARESSVREQQLTLELAGGERRQKEIEDALVAQDREHAARTKERDARQSAVTDLKVVLAAAREKEQSQRVHLERLTRELRSAEETLRSREEERVRAAARRAELTAEIEELTRGIESLIAERATTDTDAQEQEKRKADLHARQERTDALLKERVAGLDQVKDRISQREVALAQRGAERNGLVDRMREQYGEDLTRVQLAEEGEDWAAMELRIQELKEKLSRLGPVNMGALEEHDELAARMSFLTAQEQDLLNAKDSLVKAISKINTETTRLFSETFQAIREQFKQLFKELFGGGSADVVLEEGANVLEAGIEIVARPPGKKLQNISLLSGGEKALTAVALLFAIFSVRPSPFCVLDEVDAPLDESNINRFLALLEKFLKLSQFIVVTHNKRSISMSDVMYGITMEQSGVSKVVSVKFTKKHEKKK